MEFKLRSLPCSWLHSDAFDPSDLYPLALQEIVGKELP